LEESLIMLTIIKKLTPLWLLFLASACCHHNISYGRIISCYNKCKARKTVFDHLSARWDEVKCVCEADLTLEERLRPEDEAY